MDQTETLYEGYKLPLMGEKYTYKKGKWYLGKSEISADRLVMVNKTLQAMGVSYPEQEIQKDDAQRVSEESFAASELIKTPKSLPRVQPTEGPTVAEVMAQTGVDRDQQTAQQNRDFEVYRKRGEAILVKIDNIDDIVKALSTLIMSAQDRENKQEGFEREEDKEEKYKEKPLVSNIKARLRQNLPYARFFTDAFETKKDIAEGITPKQEIKSAVSSITSFFRRPKQEAQEQSEVAAQAEAVKTPREPLTASQAEAVKTPREPLTASQAEAVKTPREPLTASQAEAVKAPREPLTIDQIAQREPTPEPEVQASRNQYTSMPAEEQSMLPSETMADRIRQLQSSRLPTTSAAAGAAVGGAGLTAGGLGQQFQQPSPTEQPQQEDGGGSNLFFLGGGRLLTRMLGGAWRLGTKAFRGASTFLRGAASGGLNLLKRSGSAGINALRSANGYLSRGIGSGINFAKNIAGGARGLGLRGIGSRVLGAAGPVGAGLAVGGGIKMGGDALRDYLTENNYIGKQGGAWMNVLSDTLAGAAGTGVATRNPYGALAGGVAGLGTGLYSNWNELWGGSSGQAAEKQMAIPADQQPKAPITDQAREMKATQDQQKRIQDQKASAEKNVIINNVNNTQSKTEGAGDSASLGFLPTAPNRGSLATNYFAF